MKGVLKRLALLALVGLGTAIWFWPAWSLIDPLEEASGSRLTLLQAEGSVWRGQALLGLSDGGQFYSLPGVLTWEPLFFENGIWLGMKATHPTLARPLHLGVGLSGITVSEGQARLPASWLSSLGAPFNTIQPEGELRLDWMAFNSASGELELTVLWRDAQSALTSIRPLGTYSVVLKGSVNGEVRMQIRTVSGSLNIEGEGSFQNGAAARFSGYAWPQEEARIALTGLLSQMGRYENGRYKLGMM